MKTIRVTMDDALFDRLSIEAKQKGFASLNSYRLSVAGEGKLVEEADTIVTKAKEKLPTCNFDSAFKLRNLFSKVEWATFTVGAKVKAGRLFYKEVRTGTLGVGVVGKDKTNQMVYCLLK